MSGALLISGSILRRAIEQPVMNPAGDEVRLLV
jgi:hypothetical protein